MHAYSKQFLQVLLVGIQMATYMVDACLSKLELFARKGSKNFEISLIGPNSHKIRIRVEIGAKNKQTEVERREKGYSRTLHSPTRAIDALWRVYYAWLSMRACPRATFYTVVGRDGLVQIGRRGLAAVWFTWFPGRVRSAGSDSG